jgi:IrrE N-terminal-like domain
MMRTFTPAEQVLRTLGISKPKDIDVEVIAWHLGAKVKFRSLTSCEARIVGHGDKAIISVDDTKSWERQRFSIGHELGHWHHHRGRCLICRSEDIGNARKSPSELERVADSYSADLLLPRYIFNAFLNDFKKLNVKVLREIKQAFDVSLTAAALRVIASDRYPAILVCHSQNGREWFRHSPSVPERWFPQKDLSQDSHAFEMLFGSASESAHPRKCDADDWFDGAGASRYQVQEQSFKLPNDQVATLLILDDTEMLED